MPIRENRLLGPLFDYLAGSLKKAIGIMLLEKITFFSFTRGQIVLYCFYVLKCITKKAPCPWNIFEKNTILLLNVIVTNTNTDLIKYIIMVLLLPYASTTCKHLPSSSLIPFN